MAAVVQQREFVEITKQMASCLGGPRKADVSELQKTTGCGIRLLEERCRALVEIMHFKAENRAAARKMLDTIISQISSAQLSSTQFPFASATTSSRPTTRPCASNLSVGAPFKPVLSGWNAPVSNIEKSASPKSLPPIVRDFYCEHPEVTALSDSEAESFRKENMEITVQADGFSVPKPVLQFEHAFASYPEILRQLKAKFKQPSPIQCQTWPVLLQGRDLIGIAQTGTGKTLAFLLPAFIHLVGQTTPRPLRGGPSVLVLSPTRELALQIHQEAGKYSFQDIRTACLYGGGDRSTQLKALRAGAEIAIATPGRLNELLDLGIIQLHHVTYLVLDEADRMLDMGFEPQIRRIIDHIRPDRQTVMTSATWPSAVRRMAQSFLRKPVHVTVGSLDLASAKSVKQCVRIVRQSEKMPIAIQLLRSLQPEDKAIVFCGRKVTADAVAMRLRGASVLAEAIHGDRTQREREFAMRRLRSGAVRVLVATDVASRGLDVPDITVVLNYDFPNNIEEYVHRVGRTGRAGRTGSAYTMMTQADAPRAKDLVRILQTAGQDVPTWLLKMGY